MIRINIPLRLAQWTLVLYSALLITSCTSDKPSVTNINVDLKVQRFEQDLFSMDTLHPDQSIEKLKAKYSDFFNLFAFQVTTLGSRDSVIMNDHFLNFVTDTNFRAIYKDCNERFGNFDKYKNELTEAFRYYKFYFPDKTIPQIVTLISAFSYPVVCDSTTLGISLDMYMGSSYKYYNTLEPALPNYIRSKMDPAYLVSDAMKGWLMSDYELDAPDAKVVDRMISQGRILCLLEKLLPETPDSIRTGYSSEQLNWCKENEKKIWTFFIDNKLLFSTDPNIVSKYVSEGPTTNGFPKEAPGNIGQYLGWQIVKSYLHNNKDVTMEQLMMEEKADRIFSLSKYKPKK